MPGDTRSVLTIFAALLLLPAGCMKSAEKVSLSRSTENEDVVEQFWPDGKLRLRKEVLRKPGGTLVNHGAYVRWHDNGRKDCKLTFIRGKKHGSATLWHKNGQKWIEEHYIEGKKHGVRRVWDENGRNRKEEGWANGIPHGIWTTWKESGEIEWQQTFDQGAPQR